MNLEEIKQRMYAVKKIANDASNALGNPQGELAKAQALMNVIGALAIEAAAYIIEKQMKDGAYTDEQ